MIKESLKEVAEYLKLTDKPTYRLAAYGIPSIEVGRGWFQKVAIESGLNQQAARSSAVNTKRRNVE